MRVLIACEFSGRVRDAFIARGHNAWSCDLVDTDVAGPHLFGDALEYAYSGEWDLMVAFPPCTYLCSSGLHWNKRVEGRSLKTADALLFVDALMHAPIPKIVIENPIGCISTKIRKPDQIIQPWMFGEDASKSTCLWLKGLPKLVPTDVTKKDRYANQTPSGQNKLGPSPQRAKLRSTTYHGIADAMASQWG